MKTILGPLFAGLAAFVFLTGSAWAHCEIPCGIYDDEARINMMLEHITTIEKSMSQIKAIENEKPINFNQLVRWILNKERHAEELQKIVAQYFMAQRIKPGAEGYDKLLGTLHQMIIYAMKCKQTTDPAHAGRLRALVKEFRELYFKANNPG